MKIINLVFLGLISFVFNAAAQEISASKVPGQTSFYAELGGPGVLFSANIDRRFNKSHLGIGGRAGIGFVSGYFDNSVNKNGLPKSIVTLPIQINYLFGKNNSSHTFEVGAGVTYVGQKVDLLNFEGTNRSQVFGTASFMYRRQPMNGGFSWRVGFTPLIANGYIQPFVGSSVGFTF